MRKNKAILISILFALFTSILPGIILWFALRPIIKTCKNCHLPYDLNTNIVNDSFYLQELCSLACKKQILKQQKTISVKHIQYQSEEKCEK